MNEIEKKTNDDPIDISVVIVNYKTPYFTNKAIASVFHHCLTLKKEVFIVDNASGDNSVELIESKWHNQIKLIKNNENLGFARANNQAMRLANGRYYLLLNSDAEMLDDSVSKMVEFADSRPEIGIVGCRVISKDGTQQSSCWRSYSLAYLISRAFNLYRFLPDGWMGTTNIEAYGKPTQTKQVEVVSGCIFLVRSQAVQKAGLFDEQYFMYCEDMDWCVEMNKAGYQVWYFHEATIRHYGGGTSALIFNEMMIEQSRSVLKFIKKQKGMPVAILSNVFMGIFFLVRLPGWGLAWFSRKNRGNAEKKIKTYLSCLLWHCKWPLFIR